MHTLARARRGGKTEKCEEEKRVSSFDNKYLKGSWGRQTEVLYTHYKYNFSLVKQRNECVSNLVVLGKSFELRQCVDIIFFMFVVRVWPFSLPVLAVAVGISGASVQSLCWVSFESQRGLSN